MDLPRRLWHRIVWKNVTYVVEIYGLHIYSIECKYEDGGSSFS